MSINNKEVLIPVFELELLESMSGYHEDISNLSYSEEVRIRIDEGLFKNEEKVAELLGLERIRDQYIGFFKYGDSLVELMLERMDGETYLHGRTN